MANRNPARCSNCQRTGHNALTCTLPKRERECLTCNALVGERGGTQCQRCYDDDTAAGERELHCGICGEAGHNMRTCHEQEVRELLERQG